MSNRLVWILSIAAACGPAATTPVGVSKPETQTQTQAQTQTQTGTQTETGAQTQAAIALQIADGTISCGQPDRCAGTVDYRGRITFAGLEAGAKVLYGASEDADLAPALVAIGEPLAPDLLDGGRARGDVGTVPLTIRFADGTRATGALPVGALAVALALDEHFARVVDGPVALPGDAAQRPWDGPARGMWVAKSRDVRGQVTNANEIDWVLVIDDKLVDASCGGGKTVKATSREATIYERRTGRRVESKVFAPDPEDVAMTCRNEGALTTLGAIYRPMVDWAWSRRH